MNAIRYMLDTNIVSDLIRNPGGSARQRIAEEGVMAMSVSAVVAAELRFGYRKRGSDRLADLVENLLGRITILPYEDSATWHYARVRDSLERIGKPVGPNDLLIAAHALSLDLTLVTDNVSEFSRIDELKLENWIERETPDV